MKKKLVRDKVSDLARGSGNTLATEVLDDSNFRIELKAKLLEEVNEVISAESKDELTEEMADVLEVLKSLAATYEINFDDIEQTRKEKLQKSGAFEKKLLLVGKNGQKFDE